MFVYWVVILASLGLGVKSNAVCDEEALQARCLADLDLEDLEENRGMFPNKDFLDKYCSPILEGVRCVIEEYQRCPNVSQRDLESSEETLALLTAFCADDSEIKQDYLENVDCYNEHAFSGLLCGLTVGALLKDFAETKENRTEYQHESMAMCLGIPFLVDCVSEEITNSCGGEETRPLAEILHRFSEIFVKSECPPDLLSIWDAEFNAYVEEASEELKRKKRSIFFH